MAERKYLKIGPNAEAIRQCVKNGNTHLTFIVDSTPCKMRVREDGSVTITCGMRRQVYPSVEAVIRTFCE